MAVGENHFGVGAPPILVYFSGDWDVHWGYGILTHGHIPPPPHIPVTLCLTLASGVVWLVFHNQEERVPFASKNWQKQYLEQLSCLIGRFSAVFCQGCVHLRHT